MKTASGHEIIVAWGEGTLDVVMSIDPGTQLDAAPSVSMTAREARELADYLSMMADACDSRTPVLAKPEEVAAPDHRTFKLLVEWASSPAKRGVYEQVARGFTPEFKAQIERQVEQNKLVAGDAASS